MCVVFRAPSGDAAHTCCGKIDGMLPALLISYVGESLSYQSGMLGACCSSGHGSYSGTTLQLQFPRSIRCTFYLTCCDAVLQHGRAGI